MKKYFLMLAAAVMSFAGCEEKTETPVKADKVSIAPGSKTFGADGGSVQVLVTSSGEWTLDAKDGATYGWVKTDKISGADGEIVKFTVDPNNEEEKNAEFVFTCGEATAPFKITSLAGDVPVITVTSETTVEKDFNSGKFTVLVDLEGVSKDELTVTVPAEASWVKHVMTLEGDKPNSAKLDFSYEQLTDPDMREAVIAISGGKAEPVNVTVRQMPQPMIRPEQASYKLDGAAGTLEISVVANVEYEVKVDESGSWLTDYSNDGDTHSWSYAAIEEGVKNVATITFTEKNPVEGVEPLTATVSVTQSNALITTAANMNGYRAQFANKDNKDVFKLGKTVTVEALIMPNTFDGGVEAIIGLERRFIIRHSDPGMPYGVRNGGWELVYALTDKESNGDQKEGKVQATKALPANEWVHIAVVVGDGQITLYQNGESVGTGTVPANFMDIDFSNEYTSVANSKVQKFSFGWAYDDSRDFNGLMSEVRIWNKALTSDEINAPKHFYEVAADSEGLVAYWKLNEGQGTTFTDATANKNDLACEKKSGYGTSVSWSADASWVEVELP